jgi:hypothetical protein
MAGDWSEFRPNFYLLTIAISKSQLAKNEILVGQIVHRKSLSCPDVIGCQARVLRDDCLSGHACA